MKKLLLILIGLSILLVPVFANGDHDIEAHEDEELPDPGITPDSFLYGLDVAIDKIRLALAFNNAKRAEISLQIADERLSEVRAMIIAKKEAGLERAEKEHGFALGRLSKTIDEIDEEDETEAIKINAKIKQKLELHKVKKAEIAARIEAGLEGNFTETQKERIIQILSNIEARTSDVDLKITNKKNRLKIKLKARLNKTDEEVEIEIEDIESNVTTGLNPERVFDLIEEAQERIDEVKEEAEEKGIEFHAVYILLENSQKHLDKALEAVEEKRYGTAFGQARASLSLTRNAERIIDNPKKFTNLKKRTVKELKEIRIRQRNETRELRLVHREEIREKIQELKDERQKRLKTSTEVENEIEEQEDENETEDNETEDESENSNNTMS